MRRISRWRYGSRRIRTATFMYWGTGCWRGIIRPLKFLFSTYPRRIDQQANETKQIQFGDGNRAAAVHAADDFSPWVAAAGRTFCSAGLRDGAFLGLLSALPAAVFGRGSAFSALGRDLPDRLVEAKRTDSAWGTGCDLSSSVAAEYSGRRRGRGVVGGGLSAWRNSEPQVELLAHAQVLCGCRAGQQPGDLLGRGRAISRHW